MNTRWLLQTNIFREECVDEMEQAFKRLDIKYETVEIIPFSDELPYYPEYDGPTVAYGTTTLMRNIQKDKKVYPGMWYNEDTFKPSIWGPKFGDQFLNSEMVVTTLENALDEFKDTKRQYFVRPNSDLKLFDGGCFYHYEYAKWLEGYYTHKYHNLKPTSEVIVGPAYYNINAEWRFVVCNREVVAWSRYRFLGKVNPTSDASALNYGAFHLANKIATDDWQIDEVYCLDICQLGDEYYVIEVNCFNASGLYTCSVTSVIEAITMFVNYNY